MNKKYTVKCVWSSQIEVIAKSRDDAIDKAIFDDLSFEVSVLEEVDIVKVEEVKENA